MATITGTDPGSYVAAVPVPVPGTPVAAGDIIAEAQALANQTKNLDVRTTSVETANAAQNVILTSHTASIASLVAADTAMTTRTNVLRGSVGLKVFPFVGFEGGNANQWDFSTGSGEWTEIHVAGTPVCLRAPIMLPNGSIITRIDVHVSASGHGATIPNILPIAYFYKNSTSSGGTLVATKSDVGPVASYDTVHIISMISPGDFTALTVDDTGFTYTVTIFGEHDGGGSGSVDGGFRVRSATVYFTPIA